MTIFAAAEPCVTLEALMLPWAAYYLEEEVAPVVGNPKQSRISVTVLLSVSRGTEAPPRYSITRETQRANGLGSYCTVL